MFLTKCFKFSEKINIMVGFLAYAELSIALEGPDTVIAVFVIQSMMGWSSWCHGFPRITLCFPHFRSFCEQLVLDGPPFHNDVGLYLLHIFILASTIERFQLYMKHSQGLRCDNGSNHMEA